MNIGGDRVTCPRFCVMVQDTLCVLSCPNVRQAVAMAFTVSDFMTRQVVTVTPDDRLRQVAGRMQACGCRRLTVVEDDRLVGIITETDMLNALIQLLITEAVSTESWA